MQPDDHCSISDVASGSRRRAVDVECRSCNSSCVIACRPSSSESNILLSPHVRSTAYLPTCKTTTLSVYTENIICLLMLHSESASLRDDSGSRQAGHFVAAGAVVFQRGPVT